LIAPPHRPQVHDPEKWIPVFGKDHAPTQVHDPEKWIPVSEKIMHQRKNLDPIRFDRIKV
jgi:hypothetical protein